ncbi:hypothetical protein PsB1_2121 [Candidatus Phycosocius spiralis]|uniref:Uncharacterized protein n=1 Tax=Candidatus Phycosocius spiralis TaxID=2815099 RepID=A0ABQ4PY64_9PROT|nr:hypothetical protein PsB1_2121 [Candidatus Phycosocius spiralis]
MGADGASASDIGGLALAARSREPIKGKEEQAVKTKTDVINKAIVWGRILHSTEEAEHPILALPQL